MSKNVRVQARLLRVTPKAILVELSKSREEHWIPDSQIHDDSELWQKAEVGTVGALVVSSWCAITKGFVHETEPHR